MPSVRDPGFGSLRPVAGARSSLSDADETLSAGLGSVGDESALEGRSTIGGHRIVAKLGEGGMAHVYLAVKEGMSGFRKLLVLKILRPALADNPEAVELFLNEARLSARFNHRNVVQIYEAGVFDNCRLLVMEYLEGRSLADLRNAARKTGRPAPSNLHLSIILEALSGLAYAHELADYDGTPLNLIHRDFTPNNIFVTYDGQVKVLDFGIAKAGKSSTTGTLTLRGTLRYIAPEMFLGEHADRRSDIYAAGVCLWEAATGARMWEGIDDVTVMHRVVAGEIPSPRRASPKVPEELEALCLKALARERSQRYGSVRELQRELEAALAKHGRASAQEIGEHVESLFAEQRREMRQTIERQLDRIESDSAPPGAPGNVPVISLERTAPGDATVTRKHRGRRSMRPLLIAVLATAALAGLATASISALREPATMPPPVRGDSTHGDPAPSDPPGGDPVASVRTAPVAPAPLPRPATSEQPTAEVHIRASATPRTARIFLGDRELPGNPVETSVPREHALRTLRVEAPGYVTEEVEVDLSSDVLISLVLRRAARTRRRARAGAEIGSSAGSPAPATGPAPHVAGIDPGDPWRD
jgi:serine/threonine protein kinase